MPAHDELKSLLKLLEEGTQQKALNWQQTPTENVFRMDLPGGAYVRLFRFESLVEDEEREVRYILQLFTEKGNLLEEWSSAELESQEAGKLNELYRLARRSALDVEKQMQQILKSLREKVGG